MCLLSAYIFNGIKDMKDMKITISRPRHNDIEVLQSTARTQMQEAGGCH